MRASEVHNVVKRVLTKIRFKYMGNVRGNRQVWVSDEEDEAMYPYQSVYQEIAKQFKGLTSIYVEEAGIDRGFVEIFVDNVTLEVVYGRLGDDVNAGVCLFMIYEEA